MKVELFTHRYPPDLGGIERHVKELAHYLDDAGHDVAVHATRWKRDQPRTQSDDGIPVRRHWALAPGDAYYLAPTVATAAFQSDADVIHAHGYHSLPMVLSAVGTRGTPLVVTPHYTGRGSTPLRSLLHRAYAIPGRYALERAESVVAVSEWEQRQLRTDFGCDSTVIRNGTDIERFRTADAYEHGRPYLLSIGRLVEYKGVQHAIRALPELPGYDLLVAGTGTYRQTLEEIAQTVGVVDRVEFLGFVDDEAVPGLYAGAAAHVFLSGYECFGLTVGESLAAGTPCVVRDATALSEWDRYSGCVSVERTAPGAVADAIRTALDADPTPSDLLTWAEMAREVEAVYERALTSDSSSSR